MVAQHLFGLAPFSAQRAPSWLGVPLGPVDALNHLLGLFLPALAVGGATAAFAKLAWRKELGGASWARLAGWSAGACALASIAGLAVFGHDGMVATYGVMVLVSALALLWAGFGPGRR